jgi:hypothetical protein
MYLRALFHLAKNLETLAPLAMGTECWKSNLLSLNHWVVGSIVGLQHAASPYEKPICDSIESCR